LKKRLKKTGSVFEDYFLSKSTREGDYEHATTIAILEKEVDGVVSLVEQSEEDICDLDFGTLDPKKLTIVSGDCRAAVLVYYHKFRKERRPFGFVYGFSVQKRKTDPHWSLCMKWDQDGREYLIDPLFFVSFALDDLSNKDGVYSTSGKFNYCFAKYEGESEERLLQDLRFSRFERCLPYFPSVFGPAGLVHFPSPEMIQGILNAQLEMVSRVLGLPTDGSLQVNFSLNGTVLSEDLIAEFKEFLELTKSSVEKKQRGLLDDVSKAKFDFWEVFSGSQTYYLRLKMLEK
jgi:hypothetical protein